MIHDAKEKKDYWESYYASVTDRNIFLPSQFATFVAQELFSPCFLVDIGCGTGRDTMYFAHLGHAVVGVDASSVAIDYCDRKKNSMDVRADFICGSLDDDMLFETVSAKNTANLPVVVYARFFLHAITSAEEGMFLDLASKLCSEGGMLAVEFRTEKDADLRKATPDHFRRFVNPLKFIRSLQSQGFSLSYHVEGRGYAKYKEDDAHVARCLARMEERMLPASYPLRVSLMNPQIRSEAFPS